MRVWCRKDQTDDCSASKTRLEINNGERSTHNCKLSTSGDTVLFKYSVASKSQRFHLSESPKVLREKFKDVVDKIILFSPILLCHMIECFQM